MARKNGSGFKMKKSPAKGLSDFFSSLGKKLKTGQKERGVFSEKGKAEKKEMRKTGESKYQYDVRKKREAKRKKADKTPEQQANINPKSEVKIDPKVGMDRYTYKTTPKAKTKSTKPDWTKAPKVGTQARTDWYKKHNLALDKTTPGFKEDSSIPTDVTIVDHGMQYAIDPVTGNPVKKKSPSKKRGYKMKRNKQ